MRVENTLAERVTVLLLLLLLVLVVVLGAVLHVALGGVGGGAERVHVAAHEEGLVHVKGPRGAEQVAVHDEPGSEIRVLRWEVVRAGVGLSRHKVKGALVVHIPGAPPRGRFGAASLRRRAQASLSGACLQRAGGERGAGPGRAKPVSLSGPGAAASVGARSLWRAGRRAQCFCAITPTGPM